MSERTGRFSTMVPRDGAERSEAGGMSRLEERYRGVLRMLPGPYRRVWEEDMVAAFLESMARDDPDEAAYVADFGRPSLAETGSVIALAIRLRLGIGESRSWSSAWRPAIQLAVLAGLVTHAVLAVTHLGIMLWLSGRISELPAPSADWMAGEPLSVATTVGLAASLAWFVAYAALMAGHRDLSRALALTGTVVSAAVGTLTGGQRSTMVWFGLGFGLLLVLGLAAFPRHAPPAGRLAWVVALPVGAAPMVAVSVMPFRPDGSLSPVDWPGVCCLALVIAAAVHLARPGATARPAVSLALAMLAAAALGGRAATLLDYVRFAPFESVAAVVTVGLMQCVAVLAAGAASAGLAVGALRRLSADGQT
jgi:hypothetical protein